jgi:hypothetical protein
LVRAATAAKEMRAHLLLFLIEKLLVCSHF